MDALWVVLTKEDKEYLENLFRSFERKMSARFDELIGFDGRLDRLCARLDALLARIERSAESPNKLERPNGTQQ